MDQTQKNKKYNNTVSILLIVGPIIGLFLSIFIFPLVNIFLTPQSQSNPLNLSVINIIISLISFISIVGLFTLLSYGTHKYID